LAELFTVETGYSIRKFLTRVRVQYAEILLSHSDLPIGDIAAECGFATIQHFSRVFKQMHGRRRSIFADVTKTVTSRTSPSPLADSVPPLDPVGLLIR
jgi:AraC-like DNA-binding protein